MVLQNNKYVDFRNINAVASVIPSVNRLRRVERCELDCGKALEVHCIRFDVILGCAAYLEGSVAHQHLVAAHKTYAYMIRRK